ncbi:MAG: hypothetical protein PHC64_07540 [Candidatus Gastranaerophilales bacterium]|nr:hypothetical protein [Candidatus Gastranaerophilales bacterium]
MTRLGDNVNIIVDSSDRDFSEVYTTNYREDFLNSVRVFIGITEKDASNTAGEDLAIEFICRINQAVAILNAPLIKTFNIPVPVTGSSPLQVLNAITKADIR